MFNFLNVGSAVPVVTSKARSIDAREFSPHYTDKRFDWHPRTIFLAPGYRVTSGDVAKEIVKGVSYVYSDRIVQWYGSDASGKAWDQAVAQGHAKNSAALIEAYLRILYNAPDLKLVHILAGVNVSNGYPYRVYGYIREGDNGN